MHCKEVSEKNEYPDSFLLSEPRLLTRMSSNACNYTLVNAPDSNLTYSTILHLDQQQTGTEVDAEYATYGV